MNLPGPVKMKFKSYNLENIYQVHIHVLNGKFTINRYVKCFMSGISTSNNSFKEIESVNSNAPGRSTSFEQMLVE